ncbi:43 kDa relaxation protein [Xenorhabdus bovienii str. oregonense]|uniref:43 kDa relaxation protein n=1 Tax=Xenorhabdus bovienii str. oregonense TaxID=1398202 RepID=A0A077PA25_XENBV|nr:MobA/MobL family protein [Xenorhabdus bovienii]CDH07598.1 43 kDa relaxation protein [Xenorhabdus bovienii str. oregonense]
MAIARLSVKVGRKGKGAQHAAYIAREGKYANRLEKGEKLEATDYGNMPAWASAEPQQFWQAADAFERQNGTAYREMEIALPRELMPEQREALIRDWVKQELGERHAYQWAIHVPTAADGGEQPHCHLMFSERLNDGIARDPEQYFKRFNRKTPERGGSQKANTGLDPATRKAQLVALRERWEVTCNQHLERAQLPERIDMRSYAKQGLDLVPEKKMLPSEWRQPQQRSVITEYRHIRQEQMRSLKAVQFMEKQENLTYSPEITCDMQNFRHKHELFHGVQRFREDYQAEKVRQAQEVQQRLEEQQRQEQQARLDRRLEQQRQEQHQAEQKKIRRPTPGRGFSR